MAIVNTVRSQLNTFIGADNGIAGLDANGQLPRGQAPSPRFLKDLMQDVPGGQVLGIFDFTDRTRLTFGGGRARVYSIVSQHDDGTILDESQLGEPENYAPIYRNDASYHTALEQQIATQQTPLATAAADLGEWSIFIVCKPTGSDPIRTLASWGVTAGVGDFNHVSFEVNNDNTVRLRRFVEGTTTPLLTIKSLTPDQWQVIGFTSGRTGEADQKIYGPDFTEWATLPHDQRGTGASNINRFTVGCRWNGNGASDPFVGGIRCVFVVNKSMKADAAIATMKFLQNEFIVPSQPVVRAPAFLDIREFGATAYTDSTAAIQKALDVSGQAGTPVHIPEGEFYVSSKLTRWPREGGWMRGVGAGPVRDDMWQNGVSMLSWIGGADAIFKCSSQGFILENLAFRDKAGTATAAFQLSTVQGQGLGKGSLRNIYIEGNSSNTAFRGIEISVGSSSLNGDQWRFDRVRFFNVCHCFVPTETQNMVFWFSGITVQNFLTAECSIFDIVGGGEILVEGIDIIGPNIVLLDLHGVDVGQPVKTDHHNAHFTFTHVNLDEQSDDCILVRNTDPGNPTSRKVTNCLVNFYAGDLANTVQAVPRVQLVDNASVINFHGVNKLCRDPGNLPADKTFDCAGLPNAKPIINVQNGLFFENATTPSDLEAQFKTLGNQDYNFRDNYAIYFDSEWISARVPDLFSSASPYIVHGSGTAYTLTATSAAVDMGTTDPVITLTEPGKYVIRAKVTLAYVGATYGSQEVITVKLRRTNNTAADLSDGVATLGTYVLTTFTGDIEITIPEVEYSTDNDDDSIALFADVSATPSAGSLEITTASIVAKRSC